MTDKEKAAEEETKETSAGEEGKKYAGGPIPKVTKAAKEALEEATKD